MKHFISALWLICGLAGSLAETPYWQKPENFVTWLQSRDELNIEEYKNSFDALGQFERRGDWVVAKYIEAANLIDDLAVCKFSDLRAARDFPGVSEFFETDYQGTLKNKMIDVLSDGKDDEFSARIVYHSLGSKSWALPRQNSENLIEGFEHRRKLFNKLIGQPEIFESFKSDFTREEQEAMKRALEEKWPVLLQDPAEVRESKPAVKAGHEDEGARADSQSERRDNPKAAEDKGAVPWLIGSLTLLVASLAIIYTKSRRTGINQKHHG